MPVTESHAVRRRADWRPIHALVLAGLLVLSTFVPAFRIWPMLWLVPLIGYAAIVASVPPLRTTFRKWRVGQFSTSTVAATIIIAIASCGTLVAFDTYAHPDVSAYAHFLPVAALGGVVTAGIVFSIFNATFEELVFRGILFDSIESQWGVRTAIVTTALLFGYCHMHGYPPGPIGAVLAGIYAICLGWLRVITRGLALPILAHIAADATIYIILARSGVFQA